MSDCKPYIPSRIYENPTAKCEICDKPEIKVIHTPPKQNKKTICINDNIIRILAYILLIYILTKLLFQLTTL